MFTVEHDDNDAQECWEHRSSFSIFMSMYPEKTSAKVNTDCIRWWEQVSHCYIRHFSFLQDVEGVCLTCLLQSTLERYKNEGWIFKAVKHAAWCGSSPTYSLAQERSNYMGGHFSTILTLQMVSIWLRVLMTGKHLKAFVCQFEGM